MSYQFTKGFEAIITPSSETDSNNESTTSDKTKAETNNVLKSDTRDTHLLKTSRVSINKSLHDDNFGRSSVYLTPDLENLHQPSFSNDGILQDVSPGIFSVRTVSTSALNDKLYWDNNNNQNIGQTNNSNLNFIKVDTDATPLNKIYDITEGTTLGVESNNINDSEYSQLSKFNNQLAKTDKNKSSPLFKTQMAPQIDEAAQMLKSEIYQIPNFVGKQSVSMNRKLSHLNDSILQTRPKVLFHPVLPALSTDVSPIRFRTYEKHPSDSGSIYIDSPAVPSEERSPNEVNGDANEYTNKNKLSNEYDDSFHDFDFENDKAESPLPDIPNSMEKHMPFQYTDYDSLSSHHPMAPQSVSYTHLTLPTKA